MPASSLQCFKLPPGSIALPEGGNHCLCKHLELPLLYQLVLHHCQYAESTHCPAGLHPVLHSTCVAEVGLHPWPTPHPAFHMTMEG
uniref:Uncharacterized protein n=1 Tax=Arundo donax TaxID=35708 RepID=A0A0A9GBS7_ARUDO